MIGRKRSRHRHRHRHRLEGIWRAGLGAALVAVILASGCSSGGDPTTGRSEISGSPAEGTATGGIGDDPVRFAAQYPVESLSPQGGSQGNLVDYGFAETLMVATTDGTVVPWLAESMTSSANAGVWTIALRDGVTFHNGSPVDAEAVAAALVKNHKLNPDVSLDGATLEATGPLEVTVTLAAPNSFFPASLAGRYFYPIYDVSAVPDVDAEIAEAGLYTGAFIPEAPTEAGMRGVANPNYWRGEVHTPEIELLFIPDSQTRVTAVESGEADIALDAPATAALSLSEDGPVRFVSNPGGAISARVMITHVLEGPMTEVAVRRALGYAIDYSTLANDVLSGTSLEAESLYGPTIADANRNYLYDPAQAIALLEGAGWQLDGDTRSKDGVPLELTYIFGKDDHDASDIGVALKQMFAEVGIVLDVRSVEDVYDPEGFPTWHMLVRPNVTYGINGSPIDGLSYSIGAEYGLGGQTDAKVAALMDKAVATVDVARRTAVLADLQDRVLEQGLLYALAFEPPKAVVTSEWANFRPIVTPKVPWDLAP